MSCGRVFIVFSDFLSVDKRLESEDLTDSESLERVTEDETFVLGQQHGLLSSDFAPDSGWPGDELRVLDYFRGALRLGDFGDLDFLGRCTLVKHAFEAAGDQSLGFVNRGAQDHFDEQFLRDTMFLSSRPEELSHLDILRIRNIQFQTHDFTFLGILNGPVLSIENIYSLAGYPAGQDVKALSH